MPTLYRQLKKLLWARVPATSSVSKGHGRRVRRTIKIALAPAWIGFADAAQVAQLRRTVTKKDWIAPSAPLPWMRMAVRA